MAAFTLTVITRDPELARRADAAGVDRIGVDVERLVKHERQGHIPDARISDHELSDLVALGAAVRRAELFARLNSIHPRSGDEVEAALAAGASVLMLPFFVAAAEVDRFVRLVDGRARVVLLLETMAALVRLHEILEVAGIGEVMVGLNDLRLSAGVDSPFEIVASDMLAAIADRVRERGWAFGFGGLARVGDAALPVPADLVIAQHARLGSTSAWLARSFFGREPAQLDLVEEVARLRERLAFWARQPPDVLAIERDRLRQHLRASVESAFAVGLRRDKA
jgi:HpcH/HpaI aldolase/citrate lyase family protein